MRTNSCCFCTFVILQSGTCSRMTSFVDVDIFLHYVHEILFEDLLKAQEEIERRLKKRAEVEKAKEDELKKLKEKDEEDKKRQQEKDEEEKKMQQEKDEEKKNQQERKRQQEQDWDERKKQKKDDDRYWDMRKHAKKRNGMGLAGAGLVRKGALCQEALF